VLKPLNDNMHDDFIASNVKTYIFVIFIGDGEMYLFSSNFRSRMVQLVHDYH
jgi:hypothetical protein